MSAHQRGCPRPAEAHCSRKKAARIPFFFSLPFRKKASSPRKKVPATRGRASAEKKKKNVAPSGEPWATPLQRGGGARGQTITRQAERAGHHFVVDPAGCSGETKVGGGSKSVNLFRRAEQRRPPPRGTCQSSAATTRETRPPPPEPAKKKASEASEARGRTSSPLARRRRQRLPEQRFLGTAIAGAQFLSASQQRRRHCLHLAAGNAVGDAHVAPPCASVCNQWWRGTPKLQR